MQDNYFIVIFLARSLIWVKADVGEEGWSGTIYLRDGTYFQGIVDRGEK